MILLYTFLSLLTQSFTSNDPFVKGPQILMNDSVYNFGLITSPWKQYHTFYFANTGTDTLYLTKTDVECGCTRPIVNYRPVAPGHCDSFKVELEPRIIYEEFEKEVYIYSNSIYNNKITLRISGISRPPFR